MTERPPACRADLPDAGIGRRGMRVGIVIQARMSSARLPGKVLAPVRGRPVLGYVLDRLAAAGTGDVTLVATSTHASDDPVAAFCAERGVACLRGPLEDVAARFALACERHGLDAFVRICGDSPLIDPGLVDAAVTAFRDRRPDMVTNCRPKRYPAGQSVEVLDAAAFLRAVPRMREHTQREHVTPYFHEHASEYAIHALTADQDHSDVRLVVDTPEDLIAFERLLAAMTRPLAAYSWRDLAALYRSLRDGEVGA